MRAPWFALADVICGLEGHKLASLKRLNFPLFSTIFFCLVVADILRSVMIINAGVLDSLEGGGVARRSLAPQKWGWGGLGGTGGFVPSAQPSCF